MDREQAGYIIGNLKDCEEYDPCEIQEAKAMAIDALWAEPYKGMTNGEVINKLFPEVSEMLYDNVFTHLWWYSLYEPLERSE